MQQDSHGSPSKRLHVTVSLLLRTSLPAPFLHNLHSAAAHCALMQALERRERKAHRLQRLGTSSNGHASLAFRYHTISARALAHLRCHRCTI